MRGFTCPTCFQYPLRPEEGSRSPENASQRVLRYWDLYVGPPQKQQVFLTAGLFCNHGELVIKSACLSLQEEK